MLIRWSPSSCFVEITCFVIQTGIFILWDLRATKNFILKSPHTTFVRHDTFWVCNLCFYFSIRSVIFFWSSWLKTIINVRKYKGRTLYSNAHCVVHPSFVAHHDCTNCVRARLTLTMTLPHYYISLKCYCYATQTLLQKGSQYSSIC